MALRVQEFGATESMGQVNRGPALGRVRSYRWVPLLIFAASILITVTFWKILPGGFRANEASDYFAFYEPQARNLLAGRGFAHTDGSPATEYPPGHPLILAGILGMSHWLHLREEIMLSVFAAVGMGLSSVLIFLLARLLWGSGPALIAALLWMTYPFALWLTKQPNSEISFIVAFYAALLLCWYVLVRRPQARVLYFICGVLCGFAMLIRPIAMGIGILLALTVWFVKRETPARARLLLVSLLLLGNLVAIIPWEAWAYAKTGRVILLSTNSVKSLRDGVTFAVETKGYRENSNLPADVLLLMDDIRARQSELNTFASMGRVMSLEFRSHPVAGTKLVLLKLARSWYGTDSGRLEWQILLIQLAYLIVISWGSWQAWKQGGIHRWFVIGALLLVVYFWGMTFLALSILRYTVPVVGLVFVASAGGYRRRTRVQAT